VNSIQISFNLNGKDISFSTAPNRTLLEVLREDLGLTGAKDSCGGEGECGTCTVIMDAEPVNACLIFIGQVSNHSVVTIEGLAKNGQLHPLQHAFVKAGAVQCGYCTPGMILSAKALLDRNPNPSHQEIRESLSGNLCRCTGYVKIADAVHLAAEEIGHE